MSYRIGIGKKLAETGSPPIQPPEPETLILLARASVAPSQALADLINTTIKGLKDDGVFTLGDCLYVRGVHEGTLALQNWIKDAHNGTTYNNPVFTPKEGFKGDSINMWIDNNYTPETDGVNMTLTSISMSYMNLLMGTINSKYLLGACKNIGGSSYIWIIFKTAANEDCYLATTSPNANVQTGNGDYGGWSKTGTSIQGYLNGIPQGAATAHANAAALPNISIAELTSRFSTGVPVAPYNGQMSFSWYGGYMTDAQMLALYTRIAYFYTNVGGTF